MANISCGIVGLPNVGKSTLFNALTKKSVPAENYPFCTIDKDIGIIAVPDERLDILWDFSNQSTNSQEANPKQAKKIPAIIEFVDIAGLVRGASKGEGKGNDFLQHIRETDAIAHVVRIFDDGNILHVEGKVDPLSDIETINLELVLADLQTVTKRKNNIQKDVKSGKKEFTQEDNVLERAQKILENGTLLSSHVLDNKDEWSGEDLLVLKKLGLISIKPMLYVLNKKAGANNIDLENGERWQKLKSFFENTNSKYVFVDANIEKELKDFEGEEKENFRKELGAHDDGINNLILKSYELLGLITYFTTGEDETRGWTIKKGSTAPIAGTAIHTDFKDKFIRAEVIFWKDLIDSGSFATAREKGLLRTEGKEYIVKDGDVIEFKI